MAKKKNEEKKKTGKTKAAGEKAAMANENDNVVFSRFTFKETPASFQDLCRAQPHTNTAVIKQICELLEQYANEKVNTDCKKKEFSVRSIYRPCGDSKAPGGAEPVDLVVLIDTSGSMADEAANVSAIAQAAITAARKRCSADLRDKWFGLEGTFAGTQFTTTLRDYLNSKGISDADISHLDNSSGQNVRENGARAIEDVAKHFDWRPNAKKVIFFIGDESLEGGGTQNDADVVANDQAIATANSEQVTVYTYAGTGIEGYIDSVTGVAAVDEYARLATKTGGLAYSATGTGIGDFQQILEEIICNSTESGCIAACFPELRPCFTLRWGDGKSDRIETDDVEVLCLSARNPYSNITLKDVTLYVVFVGANGQPPATLPDGTPSVEVKPVYPICFGDLAPCGTKDETTHNMVSRELVLISRGALEGTYYLLAVFCLRAEVHAAGGTAFPLELVMS